MNRVKTIYKLQTIILLAVMLCLIVCLTIGGTASADTAQYAAEDEYDYMTFDIIFTAVARNGLQKMIPIAGVQMHFGIDYIPSTDAEYDYYVVRLDVQVAPESFATLKKFNMLPARWKDDGFSLVDIMVNNDNNSNISGNMRYETIIQAKEGVDFSYNDVNIMWDSNRYIYFDFISQFQTPNCNPAFNIEGNENSSLLSGYTGKPMEIKRKGASNNYSDLKSNKGKTCTAVYYATYKVRKNIRKRHFGFVFNQLEVWGQIGQPAFSLNTDKDKLTVLASWENGFSNRAINATMSPASGGQYFAKVLVGSSLKTVENTDTSFNFVEY